MRRCTIGILVVIIMLSTHISTALAQDKPQIGYIVHQALPLLKYQQRFTGKLQLLEDARITETHRQAMTSTGRMDEDGLGNSFGDVPARNAVLRIVNRKGQVIDSRVLERPLAKFEKAYLYHSRKPTYLLTVDYSEGSGSYNGPITFFVEVVNNRLSWLKVRDKDSGLMKEIATMKSLKTNWKLISRNGAKDILEVACRPNYTTEIEGDFMDGFMIFYTRYHFNGQRWINLERKRRGFLEFDVE